jgi:hypothetical protein
MLSKLAVGLLGVALLSVTSCGSPDKEGDMAHTPDVTLAPTVANASHGFTKVDGATLRDDGYSAPEMQVGDLRIRLEGTAWKWFTPNDDKQLSVLSEGTRDDLEAEWFAPPAYDTTPDGELFVFTWQKQKLGALTWSQGAGEAFTEIPGAAGYAVFPNRVLALASDDVWFAASATTDHFGPDFPGCPSVIRAGQDTGVIAHFDGRHWTVLPYRAKGALQGLYPREHGVVEVVADRSYLVSLDGKWQETTGRITDNATKAGFVLDGDRVIRTSTHEVVFTPNPEETDETGRRVAKAVHALPNGEVWLEVQVLTGREPFIQPETEWQAWTD